MKKAVILLVIFSMIIGSGIVSDFNKVEANNKPVLTINKTTVIPGETFTLTFTDQSHTANPWFTIYNDKGELIISGHRNRIYSDSFLAVGTYHAYAASQHGDSNWVTFTVKPAAKPVLTISGTEFVTGQTFTLTFTDHSNTANPWFTIYNDNGQLIISGNRSRVYSDSFLAAGTYHAYAASQHGDSNWVTFTVKPATPSLTDVTASFMGKTIAIKSIQNNQYASADISMNNTPMICNRDSASTWEHFYVESVSGGYVGFKSLSNNGYLSARIDQANAPVQSIATGLYAWEWFRIYRDNSNNYYIKAQINDKYLTARIDLANAPVQAQASQYSTWERFSIVIIAESPPTNSIGPLLYDPIFIRDNPTTNSLRITKSNSTTSNYVNNKVNELVFGTGVTADRVRRNLNAGSSVVLFFEGAGANTDTSVRQGALCIVIKNDLRGNPYIAFENASSTTIPDYPTNKSKNEGTPMPTVIDGIYNIISTQHRGRYDSLNIQNAPVVRFDGNSYYKSTSYGINIHHRTEDSIAPNNSNWVNSAGCFLVGLTSGGNSDYWTFINTVGARGTKSGIDLGVVIVDRSQATNYLLSLYNNNAEAVRWIQSK